jgi:phosphohistidine phosphatase
MNRFLMRHAHAEDGTPDADRPLSAKGRAQLARMADFLGCHHAFKVDAIWSSPLLRARQTAEAMTCLLKKNRPLRIEAALLPEADPQAILTLLRAMDANILLVGHNPHLAELAGRLIGVREPAAPVSFKKGAIMGFRYQDSRYQLAAYLPPSALA